MPIKFLLLGLGLTQAAGTHVITCNLSETALQNEIRSQECALQYTEGGDDVHISEIFNGDKNSKRTLLPQTFYSTHIATPKKTYSFDTPLIRPEYESAFQENEMKLSSLPDIIYFNDTPEAYQASTQYIYNSFYKVVTYCTPMGCSTLVGRSNIETQYCVIGDADRRKCDCEDPLPIGFLPDENVLGAICLFSQSSLLMERRAMQLYYISQVPLSGVAEFHYREGHYQFDGSWNNKVLNPKGEVLKSESLVTSAKKEKEEEVVEGEKKGNEEKDVDSGEYVLSWYDETNITARDGLYYKYDLSHHLGKDIHTFAISHNLHPMTDFSSSLYAVRTQNNLFLVNEKKQEADGQEEEQKEAEAEGQQSSQLMEKELYLSKAPEALWPLYVDTSGGENGTIEEREEKGPRIVIQSFRNVVVKGYSNGEATKYGYINKKLALNQSSLTPITGTHSLMWIQKAEFKQDTLWYFQRLAKYAEEEWLYFFESWLNHSQPEHVRQSYWEALNCIIETKMLGLGMMKARTLIDLAYLDKIPLNDLQGEGKAEIEVEDADAKSEKVLELAMKEAMRAMSEKQEEYRAIMKTYAKNKERSSTEESQRNDDNTYTRDWEKTMNEWMESGLKEWVRGNVLFMVDKVIKERLKFLQNEGGREIYDMGVEERNARANGYVTGWDEYRREWREKKYPKEEKEETVSHVEGQKDPQAAGPHKTPTSVVVKGKKLENKGAKGVLDGSESDSEKDPKKKGKGRLVTVIVCAVAVLIVVGGVIAIRSRNKSKQEEDPLLQNNSKLV